MNNLKHWFKPNPTRREALRTTGRYAALSMLASLGLYSVTHKTTTNSEDDCPELNLCKGCGILQKCTLPQAWFVRNAKKENSNA